MSYGKICPDCAEQVKREAKVCRFCGYRFEVSPSHTTGDDAVMSCFGVLGFVVAVVILSIYFFY